MTGILYVIGVGPGDPELLTLKAARIIREINCICVPKARGEGGSYALSITQKTLNLDGKDIIEAHFPMKKTKGSGHECELDSKWHETVETIMGRLNKGIDVAFLTIGDPSFYSTFTYLYDRLLELDPELKIEIIPGVSSINAAASRAKLFLSIADEKIAILPANYTGDVKETIKRFDTIVFMKVSKVFDDILKAVTEAGLADRAIYISKAGMEGEIIKNIGDVKKEDLNYFSVVIIKK